jgi:DNA-directed RNA polymerase alpha subunit
MDLPKYYYNRIMNIFLGNNIEKIFQLENFSRADLLSLRGISHKSIDLIEKDLELRGFKLKKNETKKVRMEYRKIMPKYRFGR